MVLDWFPWCGMLFNTKTLEVGSDLTRYQGISMYYFNCFHRSMQHDVDLIYYWNLLHWFNYCSFYIYFDFHRNEAHPHSGCLGESRKDNEEKIVDVRIRYCAIKSLGLFLTQKLISKTMYLEVWLQCPHFNTTIEEDCA